MEQSSGFGTVTADPPGGITGQSGSATPMLPFSPKLVAIIVPKKATRLIVTINSKIIHSILFIVSFSIIGFYENLYKIEIAIPFILAVLMIPLIGSK